MMIIYKVMYVSLKSENVAKFYVYISPTFSCRVTFNDVMITISGYSVYYLVIAYIILSGNSFKIYLLKLFSIKITKSIPYLIVGIGKKLYSFGKISRFKNQPCNRLYLKKPAGMHW